VKFKWKAAIACLLLFSPAIVTAIWALLLTAGVEGLSVLLLAVLTLAFILSEVVRIQKRKGNGFKHHVR
jgi:hypothetical protein